MFAEALPPRPARRVLLVQTQAENAGAQEVSRLLARGLHARGHAVRQVFIYKKSDSFASCGDLRFCASARPSGARSLARALWRLHCEIRSFHPDVVVCFQHYGNLLGSLFARLSGTRAVIANQNSASAVVHPLVRALDRCAGAIGMYDRIVAVSDADAEQYAGYPRSYRRRLVTIPHGVEVKASRAARTDLRLRNGLDPRAPLVGCAARLHPSKNLESLVRILATRGDWHVVLAGQGPDRDRLEQIATSLGCRDRLHFLGELGPEEMPGFYRMIDVFAFPSLAETFGIAAVEAALAGVPVVAHHLPILVEVLKSEDGSSCAQYVETRDTQAFAAAIARVLSDDGLAETLRVRGRRLMNRYSVDDMISSYERLFLTQKAGEV